MTWKSLSRNFGFYFVLGYWTLFLFLFMCMILVDKKKLKNNIENILQNEIYTRPKTRQATTEP